MKIEAMVITVLMIFIVVTVNTVFSLYLFCKIIDKLDDIKSFMDPISEATEELYSVKGWLSYIDKKLRNIDDKLEKIVGEENDEQKEVEEI